MEKSNLTAIARLLGAADNSIENLPDDIQEQMQSAVKNLPSNTKEEKERLYHTLDTLWQKGTSLLYMREVAAHTGIAYETLASLHPEAQQRIAYEYMSDSSKTADIFELVNNYLSFAEVGKIAELLAVPASELRKLKAPVLKQMCGIYSMEYDVDSTNAELITELREIMLR